MVFLVLAILTAIAGVVVTIVTSISLQDPFTITGEVGTRIEISGELVAALVVGVLLAVSGSGVAIALVRAQLRGALP